MSPGGGGDTGGVRGGFHRLWDPPRPGHYLQVPRASSIVGRQRLAGSGPQPAEVTAEVGEVDAVLEKGGGGCPDLGPDIIEGGSVVHVVRVRDVGDNAVHQEGVVRITPQGGLQADR